MVNFPNKLTLKAWRQIADIKAEEIATAVGVTVDTVYKWEKGKSYPTAPQMVKYLECFAKRGFVIGLSEINFF
jgi:DNA-binding transcriptional regulator YiaG